MSTPCLHIDTACLHQALSTQQKEKAEVSRLPSSEAAYADPEPQREALLSTQIILFFFFSFFPLPFIAVSFYWPRWKRDRVLLFLDSVL